MENHKVILLVVVEIGEMTVVGNSTEINVTKQCVISIIIAHTAVGGIMVSITARKDSGRNLTMIQAARAGTVTTIITNTGATKVQKSSDENARD